MELREHVVHTKNIVVYWFNKGNLKILQINASYKPAYVYGGPTMSVSKLGEQMVKAGYEIEVFTTTANGETELTFPTGKRMIIDGVAVTYFKRVTKDHSHFSPALLIRLWREVRSFDIVHIHAWWNLVSVLSCWITLLRGVPLLVSPRGTLSPYSFSNRNGLAKKMIHKLIGKQLLERSNIHVTSEREKIAINAIIQPKKVINIPNFIVFPHRLPNASYDRVTHLKLIFFSRIEEKKGLDILLNALISVTVPYHLTIAGGGDERYIETLKTLVAKNGLTEHVDWIGFQGDSKFELLQQHDLMILPSYDENFGNVVIESLSMGTAVLISKHVGLADYVSETGFGWIRDVDECSISQQINDIWHQISKLSEIRQQAPARIRKDFNEEILTEKYIKLYDQIINNG